MKTSNISIVTTFVLALLTYQLSIAQDQFLPLNIQKAYKNHTRSHDGIPGPSYWQNSADYLIEATLDTNTNMLTGSATITYFNNSPDTLKNIVIRLYQDFFRKGNARQWPINEGDMMEGTKISKMVVDGITYDPENDFPSWYITNFDMRLKQPILPKSTASIEIEWSVDIPTVRGLRMKKYDDGHYFIAYWYPQIAVYDDIDGWDRVEYIGTVEFYNDINNFDVRLTMPSGYIVWATGELQNMKMLFKPAIVKRYQEALQSDEVVQIIKQEDYLNNNVLLTPKTPVWHFKATQVPDFSFAVATNANWDGTSLVVDQTTGRRVLTDVVYPDGSIHWDKGAEVSRASVEYMSTILPGIPFPYPQMTSFCNGRKRGGMETPMMANNGTPSAFDDFAELLFHEICHTYFPFYMGTNERKYAWMDEGWAAYLPNELSEKLYPEGDYLEYLVNRYSSFAGQEAEMPLMIPTYQINNYASARQAAYTRPAMAYHFLRDGLGDEVFNNALKEYFDRWKGKHPIPYDFFNTFEAVAGENLDWFWQPWFYEKGYPDLAIVELNESNQLTVEMKGNIPIPIEIIYTLENGKQNRIYQSVNIWKEKTKQTQIQLSQGLNIKAIQLGSNHIPDVDKSNNSWTSK